MDPLRPYIALLLATPSSYRASVCDEAIGVVPATTEEDEAAKSAEKPPLGGEERFSPTPPPPLEKANRGCEGSPDNICCDRYPLFSSND